MQAPIVLHDDLASYGPDGRDTARPGLSLVQAKRFASRPPDPQNSVVLLQNLGARQPGPLSRLVDPFRRVLSTGEMNFRVRDTKSVFTKIKAQYRGAEISRLDGMTVEFPDWWFNIRASNTEPLVRVSLEANTEELLLEKKKEIEKLLR